MAGFLRSLARRQQTASQGFGAPPVFESPAVRARREASGEAALWRQVREARDEGRLLECERLAERLTAACPDDPEAALELARARVANDRPMLAMQIMKRFMRRWPDHPGAREARATVTACSLGLAEGIACDEIDSPDEDAIADGEMVQVHMARGEAAEARRLAERIVKRSAYVPAMNNLAMLLWMDGQGSRAVEMARGVLQRDPDNVHALANLAVYLHLSGQAGDDVARRLRAAPCRKPDAWAKKAEAFSVLGMDAEVVAMYEEAPDDGVLPGLLHNAAVSALRTGRESTARKLWKRAVKADPDLSIARQNLEDLEKPLGEREGPWAHGTHDYLPRAAVDAIRPLAEAKDADRAARRFMRDHPQVLPMLSHLLERGDPLSRSLGFILAAHGGTAETDACLLAFVRGTSGPDPLRLQAASVAMERGLMEPGTHRLWVRGAWADVVLWCCEVSGEHASWQHGPEVDALSLRILERMREKDYDGAEPLIHEALRLEPGAPDLMNHYVVLLEKRGRLAEAVSALRMVNTMHPDYVCAATSLARVALLEGRVDEARRLMIPLGRKRRMHPQEVRYYCDVQSMLALVDGQQEAARSWREMGERTKG